MKYKLCKNCKTRLYRDGERWLKPTYVDCVWLPRLKQNRRGNVFCSHECWLQFHTPKKEESIEKSLSLWQKIKRLIWRIYDS